MSELTPKMTAVQYLERDLAAALQPLLVKTHAILVTAGSVGMHRETLDRYMVVHCSDAQPVAGLPSGNATYRLTMELVGQWGAASATAINSMEPVLILDVIDNFFTSITPGYFPSESDPRWYIIDYERAIPLTETDGIYWKLVCPLVLVVQF